MERRQTFDSISALLSQFTPRANSDGIDIRECIALVDFYVRLGYTLSAASSRLPDNQVVRIAAAPGFGSMLAVVRRFSKHSDNPHWADNLVSSLCSEVVRAIDSFKAPRYSTFKMLRDKLSHGMPVPTAPEQLRPLRDALVILINVLEKIFKNVLCGTNVTLRDGRTFIQKEKERIGFEVSPFWICKSEDCNVSVISHVSSDAIYYISPSEGDVAERSPELVTKFIKNYLTVGVGGHQDLGRLVRDVLSDVGAYTENYAKPSYFFGEDVDAGVLFVPWIKSTSESNQSRLDCFRVGADGRREWRSESGDWIAYSDFLKYISNWQLLARRIAMGLNSFAHERAEEESSRLGISKSKQARGPTLIKEKTDPSSLSAGEKVFDLVARIDESCQRMKPSTSVFFIIGQAGLGKTDLMVSSAIKRAREIESNPGAPHPLYLFVSSSGRTLSSLEDAVNSALNITRILSSHSAKALCRNGLLVLLVDGFDELLGSSGYENALGSLEPWFRELGGRGVLVASARSSYYLTQYRRSLALATDLNVDHTLVELQTWSSSEARQYLLQMGASDETLDAIRDREWSVLRVPFFAKAFAAWLEKNESDKGLLPSVYDIVVDQYLSRESLKLKDPNIGELLSAEELRELFSEIAEMMQVSKNREVDQAELVSCAESVVGASSLEDARPGLLRRLTSLCGLGASSDSLGQNTFGFSHEVLFDCFLSLALQRRFRGLVNEKSIVRLLSSSKVNSAAFEWLLEKNPEITNILCRTISFDLTGGLYSAALSSNLGSLWSAMLSHKNGVPPTTRASGLQIESVELAGFGWSSVDLSGSTISRLVLPGIGNFRINLSQTEISYLEADSQESARFLSGVETANVMTVHIGSQYEDNKIKVQELFEKMGLVPRNVRSIDKSFRDSASHFLDRIVRRPDYPIVLSREDLTADDDRLSWIQHVERGHWEAFINALTESGAARFEPITASGKPKVRIAFNRPVTSLQDHASSDEVVVAFWSLL